MVFSLNSVADDGCIEILIYISIYLAVVSVRLTDICRTKCNFNSIDTRHFPTNMNWSSKIYLPDVFLCVVFDPRITDSCSSSVFTVFSCVCVQFFFFFSFFNQIDIRIHHHLIWPLIFYCVLLVLQQFDVCARVRGCLCVNLKALIDLF